MAHIRRHPVSGRWQVRYRDPDSRERSRTFTRRVDADRFAATVTADVVRGDYILSDRSYVSQKELSVSVLGSHPATTSPRSPSTLRQP